MTGWCVLPSENLPHHKQIVTGHAFKGSKTKRPGRQPPEARPSQLWLLPLERSSWLSCSWPSPSQPLMGFSKQSCSLKPLKELSSNGFMNLLYWCCLSSHRLQVMIWINFWFSWFCSTLVVASFYIISYCLHFWCKQCTTNWLAYKSMK